MENEPVNKLTDKPMTPEFIDIMGLMGRFKDVVIDEAKMQWYWNTLHKFDIRQIAHGINSHFADPERKQFLPDPGDIIRNLPKREDIGLPPRPSTPPPIEEPRRMSANPNGVFSPTTPREQRIENVQALSKLTDDQLTERGIDPKALRFLAGMLLDEPTSNESMLRDRLRRRSGLQPLFPSPERDKLRADYEAAKQSGDMATAQALVAQLVADLPETADTAPAWAGEGMMSYADATAYQEQYGGGPTKKGKRQTRKGGAAQR